MTGIEVKFFEFIRRNAVTIFAAAATAFAVLVRMFGMNFESDDYVHFLSNWWTQIEAGGIGGLALQVGNYNIPYQIITYFLTMLPFGPLYSYKLLSIAFDFVLAVSAGMLTRLFCKNTGCGQVVLKSVLMYALVLCLPTVVLNSSFWAQCDSIYCAFILLAIYFICSGKNIPAFVMLGIALAFKLQTVFILPLFLIYYAVERRCSVLHFFIIPAVDILMCMPAVLLGRSFSDIFTIYADQTDYGKLIQMNCPNIWAFVCDGSNTEYYSLFKWLSIAAALFVLAAAALLIIRRKPNLRSPQSFLLTAIWTVFTCIMLLSSMHERYSYLLDLLAIIYVFAGARKRIWLPIVLQLVSLRGYCYYLFASYEAVDLKTASVVYIAVYAYVTVVFAKEVIFAPSGPDMPVGDAAAGEEAGGIPSQTAENFD